MAQIYALHKYLVLQGTIYYAYLTNQERYAHNINTIVNKKNYICGNLINTTNLCIPSEKPQQKTVS